MRVFSWSSKSPMLPICGAMTLVLVTAVAIILRGPGSVATAALNGTVAGSATGYMGQVFIEAVPPSVAVTYPPGAAETRAGLDYHSIDKRITMRADSVVSNCSSEGSTAQVLSATCTVTLTNFTFQVNETTIVTADRIFAKSSTFSFNGTTASDTSQTEIMGLCVRTTQSGSCVPTLPSTLSIAVDYPAPRVTGTLNLKATQSRTSNGTVSGSGKRVTALQMELTLQDVGTISLAIGVADSFVGGVSTPVPTATPTSAPPTTTPTPTGPARPFHAVLPVVSRD